MADELQEYVDTLMSSVEDAVSEAEDEDTDIDRLEEIYNAIRKVADKQELPI